MIYSIPFIIAQAKPPIHTSPMRATSKPVPLLVNLLVLAT